MDDREQGGATPAPLPQPPLHDDRGEPVWQVTLWPHRSLSPTGLRWVLVGSALAYAIPLMAFVGTAAMLVMLPLVAFHVWLLWYFIRRNTRDGRLTETLRLWPDLIEVERREPSGRCLTWTANPFWVQVTLHTAAKLENYLTLKGGGREIELGAFLAPEERAALKADLDAALARARTA